MDKTHRPIALKNTENFATNLLNAINARMIADKMVNVRVNQYTDQRQSASKIHA